MTKDIITGPGEYVDTDGDKVVIVQKLSNGGWLGYSDSENSVISAGIWSSYGYASHEQLNITGPWVEPVKLQGWVNVYNGGFSSFFHSLGSANAFASAPRQALLHLTYENGNASVEVVETFGEAE